MWSSDTPSRIDFARNPLLLYSQFRMRGFYLHKRMQASWLRWLGVLCIALVLLTGFIQVTHTHTDGHADHEGCSLCVTAHHVVQTVALIILAVSVQPVSPLAAEKGQDMPRQRFLLKLANRPPPEARNTVHPLFERPAFA